MANINLLTKNLNLGGEGGGVKGKVEGEGEGRSSKYLKGSVENVLKCISSFEKMQIKVL